MMRAAARRRAPRPLPRRQRGAALLVALLLLALMLALGTNSLESVHVEQRVAANLRDRTVAFERAEAAALAAYSRLLWMTRNGQSQPSGAAGHYSGGLLPPDRGGGAPTPVDSASAAFWADWTMLNSNSFLIDGNYGVGAGGSTSAPDARTGRFVVERLEADDESEPASPTTYPVTFTRVTVSGPGENGANVLLQTVFMGLPE